MVKKFSTVLLAVMLIVTMLPSLAWADDDIDVIGDGATFTIAQDEVTATSIGNNTVRIQFSYDITLNEKADVKDFLVFTAYQEEDESTLYLTDSDSVEVVDGNTLIVKFVDRDVNLSSNPWILMKRGLIVRADGAIQGQNKYAYLTTGTHIDSISYEKITFDSNGGDVKATIKGTKLSSVSAKLFDNQDQEITSIVPKITVASNGQSGEMTYSVPANTGSNTEIYTLQLYVDNSDYSSYMVYIDGGQEVIAVLPEGVSEDATTLASVSLSGESDSNPAAAVYSGTMSSAQYTLKLEVKLRGTNLSAKNTKIRIIDENGIEWSSVPVEECGATVRWQNSSAYIADKSTKNYQMIELLPPRHIGIDKTYKLYFAVDGQNYLDAPYATVELKNNGITDASDGFTDDELQKVITQKVRYVDTAGNDIADPAEIPCYGITEFHTMNIEEKEIAGYSLVSCSLPNSWRLSGGNHFVRDLKGADIIYTYEKDTSADFDDITPAEDIAEAASSSTAISKIAASKITTTINAKAKTMKIAFPSDKNAVNYRIAYRKAGSSSWSYAWTAGTTSYTLKGLSTNGLYEYRVAGYAKDANGIWIRGAYSSSSYAFINGTSLKVKAGKKAFTATVTKQTAASGYQIQYSTKKSMSGAKSTTLKGSSKTKATVKKLKKGTTYYARVRTYKTSGGKTYYGSWSAVKAVKVK